MKNMFFLDFDGVLFNTVKEAYAIAVITNKLYSNFDQIKFDTEHYQRFKKYRYLISPAWNYKYLLEVLEERNDNIENSFIQKINQALKKDYIQFENDFFDTRNEIKKNDYNKWLKLNIPFEFLEKVKYMFDSKYKTYIVTTKDRKTVLDLLNIEGILFDKNKIYDKDDYSKYGSKKAIIETLKLNNYGLFIDDSSKHIKECSQIDKLQCYQPNWGYVKDKKNTVDMDIILKTINKLKGV